MNEVAELVRRWIGEEAQVALATVVETKRSAPRPVGAKMAVSSTGELAGAVSGGCVEGAVVVAAEEVIAGGAPRLLDFGISDDEAWDVGLPCGGEITVWVEELRAGDPHARFGEVAERGGRAALVTLLEGAGAKLLVTEAEEPFGTLCDPDLDAAAAEVAREAMWSELSGRTRCHDADVLVETTVPPPRLLIFGAVDYARQLAEIARASGWLPFVADPRSRFATCERFPAAENVVAAWPEEALEQLDGIDRATYVAVLTHDPKLDDAILRIALRSEAAYVGAMGSRRAQEERRARLLAAGLTETELDRLAAPIGLDLGAVTAEETALSIMAELVAVRRGRKGGRLSASAGRIHEEAPAPAGRTALTSPARVAARASGPPAS